MLYICGFSTCMIAGLGVASVWAMGYIQGIKLTATKICDVMNRALAHHSVKDSLVVGSLC